ncbi:hypothetical protein AXF42_Ash000326 [Apostasia shenzhenica]|uniref:Glycoside hydrolase family 5 domain-containing protein n=1 Tax=Apostasia shenzhenica TaxID=1088818 RepID=A0A2I0AG10_9ASPA|nr:hypothetical protein AXF42_Ash000326 [Apostasia shenzhenica]
MPRPHLIFVFLFIFLFLQEAFPPTEALPLSTSSRWIVDGSGRRVKLACVNWVAHLEAMVAEGLGKQPLDAISKKISSMGFNCVRFTWPLFLLTNESLSSLTVRRSFQALGLNDSIADIQAKNPALVDLPLLQAYKVVVENLEENKIMVILDNHISRPGWCCSRTDGNGFFGDEFFEPEAWVDGLTQMARAFKGAPNVVGMSLRNELRGPRQNVNDWYNYMQRGAEAVHAGNPNVLIILSGLSFDNDLSFVSSKQPHLTFSSKLVFELHWYAFSNGNDWQNGNPNQVCGSIAAGVMTRGGFLVNRGFPLFISEFGVDLRGSNVNDNRYLGCFLGFVAELDVDWALWTLQGSYYFRQGVKGMEEFYGVLSYDWSEQRNSAFIKRISTLQSPFQGPGLSDASPYKVIFHPATGLCVVRRSLLDALRLGPCGETEAWDYTEQKTLVLKATTLCLKAAGEGKKVELGIICGDSATKWELISDSKMHLSPKLAGGNGSSLCLDVASDGNIIVTNTCRCINEDMGCDSENQWFKIISSSRPLVKNKQSVIEWLINGFAWFD